jgi:hypothetical protein
LNVRDGWYFTVRLAGDPWVTASRVAPAYGQLAQVYAREKNVDGIAATIERGIAVEPRQASAFRLLEAMAYETLGDTNAPLRPSSRRCRAARSQGRTRS